MSGRQPLAIRLALLLTASVLVVLLVAGALVNRSVSRSLEETLTAAEQERLAIAVSLLDTALERDGPLAKRGIQQTVRRIAQAVGGQATLSDADGAVLASAGGVPDGVQVETLIEPLAGGEHLEIRAPVRSAAFLRTFNLALLVAGAVSVLAILVIAAAAANWLTRPLRGVAVAARALGAGDLRARAAGGADRESAELAGAFNTMADQLERSETLRRRAASDIAHDLATPATVLESQLQAMVDGVVPMDRAQIENARMSAAALSAIVRQLGELTGAEAAALQRRSERLDLAPLASEIVAAMDRLLRDRSVTAQVDGAAQAWADRGHVERALRNVVTNAVQHSPAGGAVVIALTQAASGMAQIRVSDAGPGIPARDVPHVFERFYRADPARASGSAGSGIGLTIARELLAANGGSIGVERTGPDGTVFVIHLPSGA